MDHNPYLKSKKTGVSYREPLQGSIERPADIVNIEHQTRKSSPSDYENHLGVALENIFGAGVVELGDIVDQLNAMKIAGPEGEVWTEQLFCSEMERLGE